MTAPVQIWIAAAYHPAYRCGGWAAVRVGSGEITGAAGGERQTAAIRTVLSGLAWALKDLPSADKLVIQTSSPELAAFAPFLANLNAHDPAIAPDEDLDLWARIAVAAKGLRLELIHAPVAPQTPIAFAAAWADLARDKAKASGAFSAAIPKPNLAKIPGLQAGAAS